MPKPRATSSTTSSGSTITYVCTLHWVICRPMYTNANRQPNHLSTCPKTLDHYIHCTLALLDFDVAVLHDFRPLLSFRLDIGRELLGRARRRFDARLEQTLLRVRNVQHLDDFSI